MASKPLQRPQPESPAIQFRSFWEEVKPTDRPPTPLFIASIPALFETLSPEQLARQFVALADIPGYETSKRWLEKLLTDRKAAVAELSNAEGLHLRLLPMASGKGIRWEAGYPSVNSLYSRDTLYAWALIRIMQSGLDRRIKRCNDKECRKIFFGDVRATWCSPRCGSKNRVRKWRKDHQ